MFQAPVVVCLLIVIAHRSSCAHQATYNKLLLEQEKICHILNKKQTHDMHNGTAVIVTTHNMLDRWIAIRNDRTCKFTFKADRNSEEGILAVIHKMYFRHNGNECMDYVRFKRGDGHYTRKICGEIDRGQSPYYLERDNNISANMINNSLVDDKFAEFEPIHKTVFGWPLKDRAELETEIVISKERVLSGQSLDLSIIYTPYRSCSNTDQNYKSVGRNICIRKEYLCDRIYNCPQGLCADESDCLYTIEQYPKDDTATKVTVGAVTTMILCFIIFVMCLWICKKSHRLCWSADCAGPNACSRPGSLPQDADGGSGSNRAVPTAPMLEVAVSSPVADKDLPPSYDSLFPEQSNPARS